MIINKDIKYIQDLIQKKRIPISVNFELTNRCNFNCIHCVRDMRNIKEMGTVKVINVLNELKKAGTLELSLTGGEVFLRKDIFKILDEVKRLRFSTTIFTNGHLIDDNIAAKLADLNLRSLDISIYALDESIHDKVTGIKGSFKQLMRTLDILKHYGISIRLKMMVFNFNVDHLDRINEYSKRMGFAFSFDEIIFISDSGSKHPLKYTVNEEQLKKVESYRVQLSNDERVWMDYEVEKRAYSRVMCAAGRSTACVTCDGKLLPCIVWRREVGDLKRSKFNHIWEKSKKMKKVLDIEDRNFVQCIKCKYLSFCRVCPGINETDTGDAYKPSMQKCILSKIKVEVLNGYTEKNLQKTGLD